MTRSPKILFVHNEPTRFVTCDRDLLRERFALHDCYLPSKRINPVAIQRAVRQADLVFAWFASWHSFLPVLLARQYGKPSVVVVGGYDTANVPEAGYGSQRGGLRRWVSRTIIRNATRLIVNSHSAERETVTNTGADPHKITVIHHGIEPFPMGPTQGRERIALTIGKALRENLLRKGLLPFVQAARLLPDVQFVHVGRWCDDSIDILRANAGPNVQLIDFIPDDGLHGMSQRAWVYVQASMHEGFGMSLAESMSAGCIPVATRAGSLPEVIGPDGLYTPSNDSVDVAQTIRQALERDGEWRQRARERVLTEFSMEKRRQALHSLASDLLQTRI